MASMSTNSESQKNIIVTIHESVTINKYSCDLCSKTFHTKDLLERHLKTSIHGGAKLKQCNQCEKSFMRLEALKKHTKTIHERITSLDYPCDLCGKRFQSKEKLRKHQKSLIHGGVKSNACNQCEKSYLKLSDLKHHVRTIHEHEIISDHNCHKCNKSFQSDQYLKRHLKNVCK